ncbi:MAG: imidazole glycerol phosphate synthase subunit HisH [Gammaproteobacteria bacterium]|nr:imidazole glycerol phosphate synthase subunit HisH [Gammaproteobacteria bacterium]MDH5593275.1 imidazole glycerol phosphate synthase subunit HisH [Gammaproteobacteria bacterium]MDH5613439.1 imidazole glycerol phosphate synthase subunit HisH [Gammaproteobacteria bacterium]
MSTVAVIDYGMGNLHSVSKALEHAGNKTTVVVSSDADAILKADRVVLPGVGAIRDCINELKKTGLDQVVQECCKTKPFLGVCVGMQALMESSEENNGTTCLGIFQGQVKRFANDMKSNNDILKVPHMGWNQVHQETEHALWKNIKQDSRFYFVHSYYVETTSRDNMTASTDYGIGFTSAIAHENIFAVQFHPEKSQHDGLQLYANFLQWDGQ